MVVERDRLDAAFGGGLLIVADTGNDRVVVLELATLRYSGPAAKPADLPPSLATT